MPNRSPRATIILMTITRRDFVRATLAAAAIGAVGNTFAGDVKLPRIRKAAEFSMVNLPGSILDRFNRIKEAGFEGVEVNSPSDLPLPDLVEARDRTGLVIHGVMDPIHWQSRLSDPDEKVRAKGLDVLCQSLRDAKVLGASTVLLVPGRVTDKEKENYQQVWDRSQEQIRKAIPVAQESGVKIGVEVVWNNFWTKPDEMAKYLDEINSPWVGAYFDVGNVVKFGIPCATWVNVLGKRIVKLHIKAYSMKRLWNVKIGEGDEDWPAVVKALAQTGYDGWGTAEVGSKSMAELRDIKVRMDQNLGA